jgi:Mlc titration factor MtfA (ptsG expression regulator)
MFQFIKNYLDKRIIKRSTITLTDWAEVFESLPLLRGLSSDQMQRLQELVILFCHHKVFEGAHGLVITQTMKLTIAVQACLPILKLSLDCYDGWVSVIIYPSGFAPKRVVRDEYGVEHTVQSSLAGEAWQHGPVVLAWDETEHAGIIDGHNLVIHEFAHKLDMQNGEANGFPPLHPGMNGVVWTQAFSACFENFQHQCSQGRNIGIDCYGASSPAEFFAVLSEVFFERPEIIHRAYADVHEQLKQYYRQDPMSRIRR